MTIKTKPLAGLRVMVTRPIHQTKKLQGMLEEQGAQVLLLPSIEIKPIALDQSAKALLQKIHGFDVVIFVSANAVNAFLTQLDIASVDIRTVQIGAIGAATASRLDQAGLPVTLLSADGRYQSESLLALPELQDVKNKSILILRGVGGRQLLGEALQKRGAAVRYLELYQRCPIGLESQALAELNQHSVDIITTYSREALENLVSMLQGHWPALHQTPLVVVSESMQYLGKKLGFTREILLAEQVSDRAVVESIVAWVGRNHADAAAANQSGYP